MKNYHFFFLYIFLTILISDGCKVSPSHSSEQLPSAIVVEDKSLSDSSKSSFPRVLKPCFSTFANAINNGSPSDVECLSLRGYDAIPDSFLIFKNVKKLFWKPTYSKSLPINIGKMENLEFLYAGKNDIVVLDTCLCSLQNLKYLDLLDNNIESLPKCICNLDSLEVINLTLNPIQSLPDCIGNMKKLKLISLQRTDDEYPQINEKDLQAMRAKFSRIEIRY